MPEDTSLNIDGAEVMCHISGDTGDSHAVVLLHGIGGRASTDFAFLFPMLARNYTVMAVDLGVPHLRHGEHLQLEHLTKQVTSAIDRLLPERNITLVGYSLGALVAAAVAASHPSTSQLILAAGWLNSSTTHKAFGKLWRRLRHDEPAQREFARFAALSPSYINSCNPVELAETHPFCAASIVDAQLQLITTADLRDIAPHIQAPTLVVGCSVDALCGPEQSEALVGAIPNATFTEVQSGHAIVVERPAQLLSLIERSIRRGTTSAQAHGRIYP